MPAPSVNASESVDGITSATAVTPAFAVGGSNRVLYAGVHISGGSPGTVTACKWGGSGGTSMTQVYDSGVVESFLRLYVFRLIAPTAMTDTVHVTFNAAQDEYGLIAVAIQDCDQTTPNGTIVGANGNALSPGPSVAVSSEVGGFVIDFVSRFVYGPSGLSVGAGQTQIKQGAAGSGSDYFSVASSSEPGATTTTMTWGDVGNGTISNWQWVQAGIPLKEVSGGGGGGSSNALAWIRA